MAANLLDNKFNEFINKIRSNSDDFVWFLFEKPCGYSFLHFFPKNATIYSLYEYLDCIWSDSINHIWDSNSRYVDRNKIVQLRKWIVESNIKPYSLGFPLVYKVYFDTTPKPVLYLDNCKCCINDFNTNNNNTNCSNTNCSNSNYKSID